MHPLLAKILRQPWRAAATLVLLTAAPKCVVCVSAYLGLGALLGFGAPELCGGPTDSPVAWTIVLAGCGAAVAVGTASLCVVCRRMHTRNEMSQDRVAKS